MMKRFFLFSFLLYSLTLFAQDNAYRTLENMAYGSTAETSADTYIKERCVLDLYLPQDIKDFATLVWFHGGGLIPLSGHTITHFTVRQERGIPGEQPVIDEMAPFCHVRPDAPPLLLITGDRDLEMLGRHEENLYMWRMMKVAGHEDCDII